MPQTPILQLHTPQQRAILATAVVIIFLMGAGAAGYYYGTQHGQTTGTTETNTNSKVAETSTAATVDLRSVSGTVQKVSANSIEVKKTEQDTTQTIVANISSSTVIQKWDFRTAKGATGGTTIALKDITTGENVVISTADTTTSPINAQKVNLVIYP